MFQIRTDIRVCVCMYTRVSQEETSLLFPFSVQAQQIIRLGERIVSISTRNEREKTKREREGGVEGEMRQGLETDCRE